MSNEAGEVTNPASIPVSDWKRNIDRLKIGHHIKNNKGEIGVITWISNRSYCYRLGTRKLG